MSFFERPDPRVRQSADPPTLLAIVARLKRDSLAFIACILAVAAAYATNVELGLHRISQIDGSILVPGLHDSVRIIRDRRDVPHIVAHDDHDLYFAEGFVQGSDRLFQLDVTRRYAYGRLAEVLGARALALDKTQRAVDINGIADRQLRALTPVEHEALVAFSQGVNAAIASQPLPVEFRMLLYRPAAWTAKDSLAVSIVASLELADSWHAIFERDQVWRHRGAHCYDALFPLSDARYDVTVTGVRAMQTASRDASDCADSTLAARTAQHAIGSNAWAAGGRRTVRGHALLANDPHLDLTIPGIWYLVDIRSPQVHAAGATIPGIPGVVLGHNERIAWASTNAETATTSIFENGHLRSASWRVERFRVRFRPDAHVAYYRTSREFSVPNDNDPSAIALVRWPPYAQTQSTIATLFALNRARSVAEATHALQAYRGSPQNFILADRSGAVAYHLAGILPNDPGWGRYVHRARELRRSFSPLPFSKLPQQAASPDTIILSANNKPYDAAYPFRLSAQFEPPYRAYRIAQLLNARSRYDTTYFARMQLDTQSPIDLEVARHAAHFSSLLRRWNGQFDSESRGATLARALRRALLGNTPASGLSDLRANTEKASRAIQEELAGPLASLLVAPPAWGDVGSTRIEHPLAPMNFGFLNGARLPGSGDEYTIRLQEPGFAQGFRAVWEVGDWDRGGIAIPSGESGEPGSAHYTDLTAGWIDGVLPPLPFSEAAIAQNTTHLLILRSAQRGASGTSAY